MIRASWKGLKDKTKKGSLIEGAKHVTNRFVSHTTHGLSVSKRQPQITRNQYSVFLIFFGTKQALECDNALHLYVTKVLAIFFLDSFRHFNTLYSSRVIFLLVKVNKTSHLFYSLFLSFLYLFHFLFYFFLYLTHLI